MRFGDRAANRQSEPIAIGFTAPRRINPIEAIKDMRQVFAGMPIPVSVIVDAHFSVRCPGLDGHAATGRRVLDCVVEQVEE